jgi:hypothetical protein
VWLLLLLLLMSGGRLCLCLHPLFALAVSGVGAARGCQQRAVLAAIHLLLRMQLLLVDGVLA